MSLRSIVGLVGLTGLLAMPPASATDQPIAATRLIIRPSRQTLFFLSRDPAFLFPAIASADEPAAGTPGGAIIDLFSQNQGAVSLTIPAGTGNPGWTVRPGMPASYKFKNPIAPYGISVVRVALLKQNRIIKISAEDGLPAGPQGAVGVRITTGSLRNCVLFDAATIRRDDAGTFIASDAVAGSLADCSNTSLGGEEPPASCSGGDPAPSCGGTCPPGSECSTQDLTTCICISGAQPCGDTAPACNGQCPAGEECFSTGGFPLPGCDCLPVGSTPCGQFQCNGTCPAGEECNYFERSTPGGSGCVCGPPGPCDGSGGDDCPPGYHCGFGPFPPNYYFCVPG